MDDDGMVPACVALDKTLAALGHRDGVRARASDAAVRTVAVVAATYCQNHQARAVQRLHPGRDLSGARSVSRFNRRLHARRDWLRLALETLGALFAQGAAFLSGSVPVPVCRRARARRCRAAKREQFCGWRLHLLRTPAGGTPRRPSTRCPPACPPGPASMAIRATMGRRTRRRSWRRPRCAWPRSARPTCARTAGRTSWPGAPTASASRPWTASWRRWAWSACARTTPGLEPKLHAALPAATIANADEQSP